MKTNKKNERHPALRPAAVAFCGILCGLSCVLLLLSAVLPTGRLALAAVAGVLVCAAVLKYGLGAGGAVFAVTAAASLLLLPNRDAAVFYAFFLGHWPLLKALIERIESVVARWALKLVAFNLCLGALLLSVGAVISLPEPLAERIWVLFPLGSAVFIVYDIALSGLIGWGSRRFAKYLS